MNNTPASDIRALRTMASTFDAQRGNLPDLSDPHRAPELSAVARRISEIGELLTDLGNEVLFGTARDHAAHTPRVLTGFAAAMRPAGEAASALGEVCHQLAFLDQTEHLRHQPDADDAREAAVHVIDDSLGAAEAALLDAADSLRATSLAITPPPEQLGAALSRSTTAPTATAPAPSSAASPTTAAPAGVSRRSR